MKSKYVVYIMMVLISCAYASSYRYFYEKENTEICTENGVPSIKMYGGTYCGYCNTMKPVFMEIVGVYHNSGEVFAKYWEMDIGDDLFTVGHDGGFPQSESELMLEYNPWNTIPTQIFGCKYYSLEVPIYDNNWEALYAEDMVDVIEDLLVLACNETCDSLGYQCGIEYVCGVPQDCGTCAGGAECQLGFCICSEMCGAECGMQTLCGEEVYCGDCPCIHAAEQQPCDGCIDTNEFSDYLDQWRLGSVEIDELMEAIGIWKNGC